MFDGGILCKFQQGHFATGKYFSFDGKMGSACHLLKE
jgi:hypothetical protein